MTLTLTGQWVRGLIDLPPSDHPARYSTEVLLAFDKVISEEADRVGHRLRIWDPMAGVGRIHRFTPAGHMVVASELEPEWAQQSPERVVVADATRPPFRPDSFNVLACSCSYGNRMADHHEAKDPCNHRVNRKGAEPRVYALADCPKCKGTGLSPRNTYRHKLGRMPTRGTDTTLPWGCVAPGTLVLRGDLRWVPASQLQVGDPIIGFDEEIIGADLAVRQRGRRWRHGFVEDIDIQDRACVRVEFDSGQPLTCTTDHPLLVEQWNRRSWRKAADLRPGDSVGVFLNPWLVEDTYDARWLAGFFDGEGSYSADMRENKRALSVAQKEGPTLDRALRLLRDRGFSYRAAPTSGAIGVQVRGGLAAHLRLLGSVRPGRLLSKVNVDNVCMRPEGRRTVVSVEPIGDSPVVLMGTTCSTYLTDGMGSHNTKYRNLHSRIMEAALGPLVGGGLVVWNTSNHLVTPRVGSDPVEQRVNEWHLNEWMRLGCNVEQVLPARTRRNRNGRNGEVRVDRELIAVLRAPLKAAAVMLPTAEPGVPIEQVRVAGGVL